MIPYTNPIDGCSLAVLGQNELEAEETESGMEKELAAVQCPQPMLYRCFVSVLSSRIQSHVGFLVIRHSLWSDEFIFKTNQMEILQLPQVVIHPLDGASLRFVCPFCDVGWMLLNVCLFSLFGFRHLLQNLRPTYVVVYDTDIKLIRELEVIFAYQ